MIFGIIDVIDALLGRFKGIFIVIFELVYEIIDTIKIFIPYIRCCWGQEDNNKSKYDEYERRKNTKTSREVAHELLEK